MSERFSLKFSIFRMLLCVTAVAVSFAAFSSHGRAGILVSVFVASSTGGLVMLAKKSNFWLIVRTLATGLLGLFLGGAISPSYMDLQIVCLCVVISAVFFSIFFQVDRHEVEKIRSQK